MTELAERGVAVSYGTVWNFIHREGMSFKKKRAAGRARSPRRGIVGNRRQPLTEVELELKAGEEAALYDFAARLTDAFACAA
jgi:hypothetical protein